MPCCDEPAAGTYIFTTSIICDIYSDYLDAGCDLLKYQGGDRFMRQKTDRVRRARLAQTREATLQPIGRGAMLNSVAAAEAGILYCARGSYAQTPAAPAPPSQTLALAVSRVTP